MFFLNDPEHVGASFQYLIKSGAPSDVYVMICGRVTPNQRKIIKNRCTIDIEKYKSIMNWLIDNHPSYSEMKRPEDCPQPIVLGGFEETTNNTDQPGENSTEKEHSFEEEQMTYASRNEPSETTGPYKSEEEFIFSHLKGEKPTLLFRRGDFIGGHNIDLVDLFPLIFPYGWGGLNEKRATKVSRSAMLRHYCKLSLPQMQKPQFLLVICGMWQRLESFRKCIVNCKSRFKSSTVADCLSVLSQKDIENALKHILSGEKTKNPTLQKLFTNIRGHSSSIGHSNEAASFARQKLFSLWHFFGPPTVFFTVTPCDECSFRVRLYATSKSHKLPDKNDMENQNYCLLDLNTRKKLRTKYPGACVTEYRSIIQIVINILIGWNEKTQSGRSGIFGVPIAYADCCEEQARFTLHSHISIWIQDFNTVRNLLFDNDDIIRQKAKSELESYFKKIAQVSFGDLFDFSKTFTGETNQIHNINDILIPPKDQDLRHMRHHIHCQDLHGVIGYYPLGNNICNQDGSGQAEVIDSKFIVERNTQVVLGGDSSINHFTKHQLDILSYTFPYHMKGCNKMRPPDCYKPNDLQNQLDTLDDKIKQFNLRHPMIQLRFNIHDCYHRPSCFKKGPECRTELPQKHRQIATIQFDKNNTINWYFIDGSIKKIAPFKYHPKRNIGDQFMNVNNDIATTVLACNNNVTSGDKACFFYVTLYQTKHNQKEEAFNYHNVCLDLSKRIKFHQETLNEHSNNEEDVSPNFAEGLKRMLASLYGHTSKNVLSSTMAAKLLANGERFKFSHEFTAIPLKHLLEWLNGEEELEFKLRKVKKEDRKYEHIHDMFINNIIYRPVELEKFGCYDMITRYDLRRMLKEKIESNNLIVESKKTFNLVVSIHLINVW